MRTLKIVWAVAFLATASMGLYWLLKSSPAGIAQDLSVSPKPRLPDFGLKSPEAQDIHEEKVLTQALAKKPGHTPVLLRLAEVASSTGRPQEAINHLREILKNEPDNPEARLELGKALYETADIAGAIKETSAILEINPRHPDALYNLGAIYGNLGQTDKALEFWERLVSTDPGSESGQRAKRMMIQIRENRP